MRRCLILLCVLFIAPLAIADKIVLKDGRTYEGLILEENEKTVKIKTARATLSFSRDQVESIEKKTTPLSEREQRFQKLDGSSGAAYLETAEWLSGNGREVMEIGTLRLLCQTASFLDKELAGKAQALLARENATSGNDLETARAWARAVNADNLNPDYKAKADDWRKKAQASTMKQLAELRSAVDGIQKKQYFEAIGPLRRAALSPVLANIALEIKLPCDALADDLQRRIPCKACDGKGTCPCDWCKGTARVECDACKGRGIIGRMGQTDTLQSSACRACIGVGWYACTHCEAEVELKIEYRQAMGGNPDQIITVHALKDKDDIRKIIDTDKWTRISDKNPVLGFKFHKILKGGTAKCGTCMGIKFDPPVADLNWSDIQKYIAGLSEYLDGKLPVDCLLVGDTVYDTKTIAGGYKYKDGKWVK